jgi:predicted ATPase
MTAALARHDQVLRQCIECNRGYVFKTVGDAFCAAFETAVEGMDAALQSQAALLTAPWEVPGGIRVRMALHTGTAEEREGDYFGQTLNRVARLLSIGYGGQTLVSLVTAELLRDLLPQEVSLQDLGAHRLKDLLRPESVFQVVRAGLRSDFPALKSLDNHPHNLPLQPSPFIGREKELEAVQGLLSNDHVRLLTLTGIGGTGKTRLSLQAAANLIDGYPDGVFFVDLSAVDSAAHVVPMIARTLGVRETGARPLNELLQEALHDRQMLLILDNFEQVLKGVPHVVDLLASCSSLKILVTSREALHIRAERVFRVPPLSVPRLREAREMPASRLSQYEAVSLFIDRAVAVNGDFQVTNENAPAIAEICACLDGLPLAVELAAARVNVLTPKAILERLGSCLKLLSGGAADLPFRQRTLRATIDWSFRLLTPAEQSLFQEAAVFSGGCTLEAMEAVCSCGGEDGIDVMETLSSLVGKSLLSIDENAGGKRFVMFESLREYGLALLESVGAINEVRNAHASYFLQRAEEAVPLLSGPHQKAAFDSLEADYENFRAALDRFKETGEVESELRLCAALGLSWKVSGHLTEGRDVCRRALAREGGSPGTRASVLVASGALAREQGDYSAAISTIERGIETLSATADASSASSACNELGLALYRSGDIKRAQFYFERARATAANEDTLSRALAENGLGLIAEKTGKPSDARAHFESSMAMIELLGDDRLRAHALMNLANVSHDAGDTPTAIALCREASSLSEQLGDGPYLAIMWNNLGFFHSLLGEYEEALSYYVRLQALSTKTGNLRLHALALAGQSDARLARGDREGALAAALASNAIAQRAGEGMELGVSLRVLGESYLAAGKPEAAKDCFARSIPLLEKHMELEDTIDLARARKGLLMAQVKR